MGRFGILGIKVLNLFCRILGYRRAVPTVGRVMNLTGELQDKADKRLKKTFFVSPGVFILFK